MSLVTSAFAPPPVRLSCRERRKTEGVFSHLTPDVRLPGTFFGFTPVLLSAFCSNLNFDCKAKWRERDNFLCIKAFFTQQPLVERWNLERGSFNCFLRKTRPSLLSPMWPCLSNPPSVKGALYFCLLCHSWMKTLGFVCMYFISHTRVFCCISSSMEISRFIGRNFHHVRSTANGPAFRCPPNEHDPFNRRHEKDTRSSADLQEFWDMPWWGNTA